MDRKFNWPVALTWGLGIAVGVWFWYCVATTLMSF